MSTSDPSTTVRQQRYVQANRELIRDPAVIEELDRISAFILGSQSGLGQREVERDLDYGFDRLPTFEWLTTPLDYRGSQLVMTIARSAAYAATYTSLIATGASVAVAEAAATAAGEAAVSQVQGDAAGTQAYAGGGAGDVVGANVGAGGAGVGAAADVASVGFAGPYTGSDGSTTGSGASEAVSGGPGGEDGSPGGPGGAPAGGIVRPSPPPEFNDGTGQGELGPDPGDPAVFNPSAGGTATLVPLSTASSPLVAGVAINDPSIQAYITGVGNSDPRICLQTAGDGAVLHSDDEGSGAVAPFFYVYFEDDGVTIPVGAVIASVTFKMLLSAVDEFSLHLPVRFFWDADTSVAVPLVDLPGSPPFTLTNTIVSSATMTTNPVTGLAWARSELFAHGDAGIAANGAWQFNFDCTTVPSSLDIDHLYLEVVWS